MFAVRAKFTSLDRCPAMALVAKACRVVELCQAGLLAAKLGPYENIGYLGQKTLTK